MSPEYRGHRWDFGSGARAATAYGLVAYSQVISYPKVPSIPVRMTNGRRIGGWSTCAMEVAQDSVRWWIPGMLKLIQAIEDAPEPETQAAKEQRLAIARERMRLEYIRRSEEGLRRNMENGMEWARGWWDERDPSPV